MKEAEWLALTDPVGMLIGVEKRDVRARRYRLFAAACCRRAWASLADPRSRDAVEVLERFADGPGKKTDQAELRAASEAASAAVEQAPPGTRQFFVARTVDAAVEPTLAWWTARWSAELWLTASGKPDEPTGRPRKRSERQKETAHLVGLLRDVLGNPFRPQSVAPAILTPTVVSLARAAYDARQLPGGELDPVRLAVLADALEELGAGEVVEHLRGPGPHVRGCWVVDALLGRP